MEMNSRFAGTKRIVDVQTEDQPAASTTAPLVVPGEVVAGQTAEIIVQAVNGKAQGGQKWLIRPVRKQPARR